MKKYIVGAIILLTLMFGGWYFASPLFALSGLRDAALEGDANALEKHIDFPEFKKSLKSELKNKITDKLSPTEKKLIPILGSAFADTMMDQMIEEFITPKGIANLVKKKSQIPIGPDIKNADKESANKENTNWEDFKVERIGLSTFIMTNQRDKNSPLLIFKRDGISWKLSAIDMSDVNF